MKPPYSTYSKHDKAQVSLSFHTDKSINEWCFRTRFCTVKAILGQDEFCYEFHMDKYTTHDRLREDNKPFSSKLMLSFATTYK